MRKLVSTLKLPREDWLQYRKRGIGGSDAGAICGFNPYRTAMQVYYDKTSDEIEDIDNEAMRQGREFEDYVARRFTEETGKKVRRANAMFYDEMQEKTQALTFYTKCTIIMSGKWWRVLCHWEFSKKGFFTESNNFPSESFNIIFI